MIVLRCPYCREQRTEEELTYGGEAGIARPDSNTISDSEWTDYLFVRANPKGVHQEQWCCSAGCGQWFKVARHTVTHEVTQVLRYDEPFAPEFPATVSLGHHDAPAHVDVEEHAARRQS